MAQNFQVLGVKVADAQAPSAEVGFYAVLRDSISSGMIRVLGAEGTQAILYHLGLTSFDNPRRFHERLKEIFGFGTASLERVIIQQLHQATGVSPALTKNGDFVEQVELAKRSFDAKTRGDGRRPGATA